ncbi:MAG: alcohol dehydrogenase catalytic domain-containing protein [Thermodesulfobacteriota bacterium]
MKAVVVDRIGAFAVREVPRPAPGPDEVLLRVDVTGLCRTDLKIIEKGHRDLVLPRIPGEEAVGTVLETGSLATGFRPGDRVYVYPGTSCGACPMCAKGAGNLCRDMRIMGFHRDGGFAPLVCAPEKSLLRVPGQMPADTAVFAEPLSCCLNALELARLGAGERISIWGGGPAGALMARAARSLGARVRVVEPDPRRRAFSGSLAGDAWEESDVCAVAVGSTEAYAEAAEHLGPRGRLLVFSGLAPSDGLRALDLNRIHYLEQSVIGAYGCSFRHGEQALAMLESGAVAVEDLVTHRMGLGELQEALDLLKRRISMKILLYPEKREE